MNSYYTRDIISSVFEHCECIKHPQHKSAQMLIYIGNSGNVYLQSYNTLVSWFERETGVLHYAKYSVTTSKHQCWFNSWLEETGHVINERKLKSL